jgi:hypothetical protein
LPVYDCQGSVVVRFSSAKDAIEVVYHHLPIHPVVPENVANAIDAKRLYQARWVAVHAF